MNIPYQNSNEPFTSASLLTFLTIVFKRKWVILATFCLVLGTVTVASFIMPPVYRASSKMIVEQEVEAEKALLFRMNLPAGYEKYDRVASEMEIIRSYPVAMRTVRQLNLIKMADAGKLLTNQEGDERFKRGVEKFQKRLQVRKIELSNVVDISYEADDPVLAAEVVNRVTDIYIKYRSEIYDESDTYKFFEDQMHIADQKLRELEQHQAQYRGDQALLAPESQKNVLLSRLADYEKAMTDVRTKRIGKEARLEVIKKQLAAGRDSSIPSTESSNSLSREKHIAKLRGELLDLELQRERLLQKYTPEFEDVVNIEMQIAATQKKIEDEIQQIIEEEETAIGALQAEEEALLAYIVETSEETKSFVQKEYEYSQLSRGIEDNREIYSMLLKQREEARISLAKLQKGVQIKIISPAVAATDPVRPRKALNMVLAAFLGFFGGLGLALTVEYLNHSVNTVFELRGYTGLTVLGSVREINSGKLILPGHLKKKMARSVN